MRVLHRMPALLVLAGLLFGPSRSATAQQVVELSRIRDYVNQRVQVSGKVADVRRQRDGEVWMSLERAYPAGPLVIVLTPQVLNSIPDYAAYRGRLVRVSGMVRPSSLEAPPPATGTAQSAFTGPSKPYIQLEDAGKIEVLTPP